MIRVNRAFSGIVILSSYVLFSLPQLSAALTLKSHIPDPECGVVDISPTAHLFYSLYHTTSTESDAPLVLWFQGGPGGSSYGVGNFFEIGPLDEYLRPRNHTWLNTANLLFCDFPVGAGFSWTTAPEHDLAKNNGELVRDAVVCFFWSCLLLRSRFCSLLVVYSWLF